MLGYGEYFLALILKCLHTVLLGLIIGKTAPELENVVFHRGLCCVMH